MRGPLLVVALLLALPLGAGASDPTAGWRVARVIDSGSADPARAFEAFDTASLALADLDGDGRQEIVTLNDNNVAYVIDGAKGRVLAQIETTHGQDGASWEARDINPISVAALSPGGPPCLVIPNSAAYVSAWCYQGQGLFGRSFRFARAWEIDADASRYEK